MEVLKKIIKKFMTKEIILYIIFGGLTTCVNLGAFYLLNSILNIDENVSNLIAIVLAVLVAYVTNKDLVFHSKAKSSKEKLEEFIRFILGRAFTMVIEFVGGLILFKLPIPNIISKVVLTVVVIVLNFFISKFFAFTTGKEKKNKIIED